MPPKDAPTNEFETTTSIQRVAVAVGALVVVILTVVAALFLAMQDLPGGQEPTPVVQVSPSPVLPAPTATPTAVIPPTFTPELTATPVVVPATTEIPPTAPPATATGTFTPVPPSPTATQAPGTPTPPPPTPTPRQQPTPTPATGGVCRPPDGWVAYTAQAGDTLNSLANRTGSSVFELQQVNCLESFNLQTGQTIYLPFTPPTPTVTLTPTPTRRPGPTPTRTATPISPAIDSVTPNRVDRAAADDTVVITVQGRNFRPQEQGFRVELRGPAGVELELGPARSSTSFEAIVPPGLPEGTYDMVVTNPGGRAGTRQSAYTIGPAAPTSTPAPAPDIIRFTPTSGKITEEIVLTVQGRDFQVDRTGFKVELQATSGSFSLTLELGDIRTDTNFTAIIRAGSLERGDYNLIVTNPDGRSDIASDRYQAIE